MSVNADRIELRIGIADLADAIIAEMGHPAKVWTRKQLRECVATAFAESIEKIKQASSSVM